MPHGRSLPVVAIIGLVLSGVLLAWVGWSWWSPPSAAPEAPTTPAPISAANVVPTPEPTETVTREPTTVLRFEIPSAGYSSEVATMEIANAGVINPPDFRRTWWIRDRGVAPSSQATDTTYLACHTDAAKAVSAVPCNGVHLDNVPLGSPITVTTDVETLQYTVIQARKVPRDAFAHDTEVWDVNPGRLVWVSCYLSDGRRSDFNLVVVAELTA